jgi:hypothetical protein
LAKSAFTPGVLTEIGSFGGLVQGGGPADIVSSQG